MTLQSFGNEEIMGSGACAELVRHADPERFLSVLTAPVKQRAPLMVLYAFNLEIARAGWVTKEPMIAEMRLQFWVDTINNARDGKPAPAHEVAAPLVELVRAGLKTAPLLQMIKARRDHALAPQLDAPDALWTFLDQTAGNLMWLAARGLGASVQSEPVIRQMAAASGLAALFVAVPALDEANRAPFAKTSLPSLQTYAREGLLHLRQAHAAHATIDKSAAPALRTGYLAKLILARAAQDPNRIALGDLLPSEFRKRLRMLRLGVMGTW